MYFLTVLEAEKTKIKVQQGSVSDESSVPGLQVTAICLCTQITSLGESKRGREGERREEEGRRELSCVSSPSYKGISSVELGSHPSDLYHYFTGPIRHVGD